MTTDITVDPSREDLANTETEEKPVEDKHQGLSHLNEEDREYILRLRNESKEYRLAKKELAEKLAEKERQESERKQKELEEQGRYKELLEEKEKEIERLKNLESENSEYKETFTEQLDTALKKLNAEQQELIEDSGWSVNKKLKWALKMSDENKSKTDSPGSQRPGGDKAPTNIDLSEYKGPSGRKKLAALRNTNPKLYQQILDLR